jgi:hypothetical protein
MTREMDRHDLSTCLDLLQPTVCKGHRVTRLKGVLFRVY